MPRLPRLFVLPLLALAASLIYFSSSAQEKTSKPDFDMTASYIEACSCDMFCPCYFNAHSTNHMSMGDKHMDEQFRSEEHTSELQSLTNLVCRLLLEKKK